MVGNRHLLHEPLKILFVITEVVPFAKTGGLADVGAGLPKALTKLGHDVRVVMPLYQEINVDKFSANPVIDCMSVPLGSRVENATVKLSRIPDTDIPVYLIGHGEYFAASPLYQAYEVHYRGVAERFIFFSRAVLEMLSIISFTPDIIHCNDWHTALIPVYLKTLYSKDEMLANAASIYTIHNLAYQGVFDLELLPLTSLAQDEFASEYLEHQGKLNFTRGALVCADVLNTVSMTYSREIQTPECGCGLENVLAQKRKVLFGVLNGVDYQEWNPAAEARHRRIPFPYKPEWVEDRFGCILAEKAKNKLALQKARGLDRGKNVPVIGMVTRIAEQKGFDLIEKVFDTMMGFGVQFVLLGRPEERYIPFLQKVAKDYPGRVSIEMLDFNPYSKEFCAYLDRMIYAGSDIYVMPSRYEPCGLSNLIALRYGTVPLVRSTGGLADTIQSYDSQSGQGNGFSFKEYSPDALLRALEMAVQTYRTKKDIWQRLMMNGMMADFSWEASPGSTPGCIGRPMNSRRWD